MNTTEVYDELNSLEEQLSKQQLPEIDNMVGVIKSRVIKSIESDSLEELLHLKEVTALKILTEEAHKSMPDIPRDIFLHKLHYVMNAFNTKIKSRINMENHSNRHTP